MPFEGMSVIGSALSQPASFSHDLTVGIWLLSSFWHLKIMFCRYPCMKTLHLGSISKGWVMRLRRHAFLRLLIHISGSTPRPQQATEWLFLLNFYNGFQSLSDASRPLPCFVRPHHTIAIRYICILPPWLSACHPCLQNTSIWVI